MSWHLWTYLLKAFHLWLQRTVLVADFKPESLDDFIVDGCDFKVYGHNCAVQMRAMRHTMFAAIGQEPISHIRDLFKRIPEFYVLDPATLTLESAITWKMIQETEMMIPESLMESLQKALGEDTVWLRQSAADPRRIAWACPGQG